MSEEAHNINLPTDSDLAKMRSTLFLPLVLPITYGSKNNSFWVRNECAKALNSIISFFIISIPTFAIFFAIAALTPGKASGALIMLPSFLIVFYWVCLVINIRITNRSNIKNNKETKYYDLFHILKPKP